MSLIPLERANFSDFGGIIFVMLTRPSAIVTSRKRKLRELFVVASQVDPLPDDAFTNPDAPAATQAEWQFLQANDILQYVDRECIPFIIYIPFCNEVCVYFGFHNSARLLLSLRAHRRFQTLL